MLLEVVDQAAGRADEHVAAGGERLALAVVVDAAVDGEDAKRRVLAQQLRVGFDLHDELAGGRDDQHARLRAVPRTRRRLAEQPGERGDQKRRRLARARLRLSGHVLAAQRERQRRFLDRGRRHETGVADAVHDRRGQIESRELHQGAPVTSDGCGAGAGRRPNTRAQMMPTS